MFDPVLYDISAGTQGNRNMSCAFRKEMLLLKPASAVSAKVAASY